jgi:4-hydroxy-tetrahydrodipicolinate synthase
MTTSGCAGPEGPGIRGIWPALMTPLGASLALDHTRLLAHAVRLLDAGCGGVTPFGTTGEGPSFSVAERREAVDWLVRGGIAPSRILVSVSCAALPDTLALTRHAQDIGAWGVLLMPPFFFKGVPDAGIVDAYCQVLDACAARPLRVVLYHIPQVAGVGLSQAVIAELLRRYPGNIVAIKDSQCDRAHSLALADAFMSQGSPRIGVHVGNELDLPALAARGSRGAVSGLANFMPRTVRRLATEPDSMRSAVDHARVQRLLDALDAYSLIPALKAIMAAQTGDAAWLRVRPPLRALDAAQCKALAQGLAGHRLDASID